MPVPDYETLMLPVLRLIASGAKNVSECLPTLKDEFGISDEEARELIPSGRITVLQSRAHWARTYLSKAGLLHSSKRNLHLATDLGRQLLAKNPQRIDNKVLDQFSGFNEWRTAGAGQNRPWSITGCSKRKTCCGSGLATFVPRRRSSRRSYACPQPSAGGWARP